MVLLIAPEYWRLGQLIEYDHSRLLEALLIDGIIRRGLALLASSRILAPALVIEYDRSGLPEYVNF